MKLMQYQHEAVEKVLELLSYKEVIKFQAPTGSGKTFMTAHIIQGIVESSFALENKKLTFVYIAPSTGQLDYQGYEKIRGYLDNDDVKGFSCEFIGSSIENKNSNNYLSNISRFEKNKVYFLGWDLIKTSSRIFSEGERQNLFDVIRQTNLNGTKVVLFIDEAHREYGKNEEELALRNRFLEELAPIKKIEMSATLKGEVNIKVLSRDVKDAGVIKQSIIINAFSYNWSVQDKMKKIIQTGIDKRKEIEKSIAKTGRNINPLLLIQIPDGNPIVDGKNINDFYLKQINEVLGLEKNRMKEGYDYAIWLDKNKTTKDKASISRDDSQYKVVTFKQAIATGWDVPRACVLVKLRNPKEGSKSFEIQTLGRILRNPFLKIFKSGNNLTKDDAYNLNSAFVYTNDENWKNKTSEIPDYEDILDSKKEKYKLSAKAKSNVLSINKIRISNDESFDHFSISQKMTKHHEFMNKIKKQLDLFKPENKYEMTSQVLSGDTAAEQKIVIDKYIDAFNLSNDEDNLFYLHVKFLEKIKSNKIIICFVDELVKLLGKTKKIIYKFFIEKYNTTFLNNSSLSEAINICISIIVKNEIKYDKDDFFKLVDEIEYSEKQATIMPTGLFNSYELLHKVDKGSFDSDIELDLYKAFNERWQLLPKSFHLFRNKTSPNDSYHTQYFNSFEAKVNNFFPDFIATTEKSVFIIECKGLGNNNVDKNVDSKMESLWKNADKISDGKKTFIIKVGNHKSGDKLEVLIYTDDGECQSKNIDYLFELINKN